MGLINIYTLDQKAEVRRRWCDERESTSKIAEALGITRNAVAGLVHRNGWMGGVPGFKNQRTRGVKSTRSVKNPNEPVRGKKKPKFPPQYRPKTVEEVAEVVRCKPLMIHIADLEHHHCRWVIGDPEDLIYCGLPRKGEKPFCAGHAQLAYISVTEARRRAHAIVVAQREAARGVPRRLLYGMTI